MHTYIHTYIYIYIYIYIYGFGFPKIRGTSFRVLGLYSGPLL